MIRGTAGELVGIIADKRQSRHQNPNHPLLAVVSPPVSYRTYLGSTVDEKEIDLTSRLMFMQVMHKTYPGSGAICTGVAAKLEGTIPYELARGKLKTG